MFIKLAELGKAVSPVNTDPAALFYEKLGDAYTIGIRIEFSADGKGFERCQVEDFSGKKGADVPYKKGAPNGFDPLPVTKMSKPLDTSPVTANVVKRIGRYVTFLSQKAQDPRLNELGNTWQSQNDLILDGIEDAYHKANTDKKKSIFYFISMAGTPLWDFDDVKSLFKDNVRERFQIKDNTKTVAKDRVCAICGRQRSEVYGNVSLIQTYNLDQPGFIAGGAKASMGTKNLPVCLECTGFLSKGFDYAKNNLGFSMGGVGYLLIPSLYGTSTNDRDFFRKVVNLMKERGTEQTLQDTRLSAFAGDEERILRMVAKDYGDRDQIELTMVFYKKGNNMWRIRAEIPRILPSRLKQIYEAKEQSEKLPFLKKGSKADHISVGKIKDFSKDDAGLFAYIDAIFADKSLRYKKVVRDMVNLVTHKYKSSSDSKDLGMAAYYLRHGVLMLDFMDKLGVITFPKGGYMDDKNMPAEKYVDFMNEYQRFFSTNSKRVAFLTGILIAKLLQFQKGSEAFRKKLGDYRFDLRKLKRLRPQIEAKIAAYDRDKHSLAITRDLRSLLDLIWARAEAEVSQDSDDDLTLAVLMGMNLDYYVGKNYQKEENDD